MKSLSRVLLFPTPWTVAYQAPPSVGFSRQENWSGLPFPSPGDLPNPGIEPGSPALEKAMAIHSNALAWKIPWTEEPDRLQTMGSQRVRHDSDFTFTFLPHCRQMLYHLSHQGNPFGTWGLLQLPLSVQNMY